MKFGIGVRLSRVEDARFLRGEGQYVDDMRLPGQLVAKFLRSPVGHGRLRGLDVSAARQMPGVRLVLTAADLAAHGVSDMLPVFGMKQPDGSDPLLVPRPHLTRDRITHIGQPLAMVVAETEAAALDALEAIDTDIEELPAVVDAHAALADDAPQLHPNVPNNRALRWQVGDQAATDAAFARAHHITKVSVENQRIIVNAIEPRAVQAEFTDGRFILRLVSQGSHGARDQLARQLGVTPEAVRVITPDVGGGFGMKLMAHPEYAPVALAAKLLAQPVGWTADRAESFVSDAQGRDLWSEAEGAFDRDGRILAFRWHSISNLGGWYSQMGAGVHTLFSGMLVGGMYRVPHFFHSVDAVFTNTVPTDAYRGAGRPEVIHVTERVMDQAAYEMGIDPVELRRINLLTPAELPWRSPGGLNFDSLDPVRNLDDVVAMIDRPGFAARRAESAARGRLRGLGIAYYMERTGGNPFENARIRIDDTGVISAMIGTQSTGQGHETAWGQIIAARLGVRPDQIRWPHGDSDSLPRGYGTGGSRSAIQAGKVLRLAADDLIEQGKEAAAQQLECAVADIEFTPEAGGRFRIMGTDRSIGLVDVAMAVGGMLGHGEVKELENTFPNGCHACEIEIDPETGKLEIVDYAIADDFGNLINPNLVEGQVHGGTVQGLGQILGEVARYDPDSGQLLSGSYMDYWMPRADDVPMIRTKFNEIPAAINPLGVKGCGEAGSVGAIPALALAALDALRPVGVHELILPLSPLNVWTMITKAQS